MSDNYKNILSSLAKEFGIKKLVLFGSAINSFENARDIDFACEGITGKDFLRFGSKLEDIFDKEVDLIRIEENSRFVQEILKKGLVVYES